MTRRAWAFVIAIAFAMAGAGSLEAQRVVLVAGGGGGGEGAPALEARLVQPFGVDFDRSGNLFIVELAGQRVLRVDPRGIFTVIAGTGEKGDDGDGGSARRARFNGMHALAIDDGGDLYLADTWNNRVRRIEAKTGVISAAAGTGTKGFGGDGGPAEKAEFGGIYCVALDRKRGRLLLADLDNRRIRAVDLKTRAVSTLAGNGEKGIPEDGAEARSAPLVDPRAAAAGAGGEVYILERSGHALRAVDASGKIRTIAGTGKAGSSGDGGEARKAGLNGPKHIAIDLDGSVIIADTENHRIRRYTPADGRIVAVAGSGKKGAGGIGGPPLLAELSQPHGVYVHSSGILYIADSGNDRILRIEP